MCMVLNRKTFTITRFWCNSNDFEFYPSSNVLSSIVKFSQSHFSKRLNKSIQLKASMATGPQDHIVFVMVDTTFVFGI